MKRLSFLATLVAGVLFTTANANAGVVIFDASGSGDFSGSNPNAFTLDGFDWDAGNVVAVGAGGLTSGSVGFTFANFVQARLANFISGGGTVGVATGEEFTLVSGFNSVVASFNAGPPDTAIFAKGAGGPNFFEIRHDTTANHSNATGMGFEDGTLILSGKVSSEIAVFVAPTGQSANLGGGAGVGVPTVNGVGGIDEIILTDLVFNPNYFSVTNPPGFEKISLFTGQLLTPFTISDVAANYWDGAAFQASNPGGGGVNGLQPGSNFVFQHDGTKEFLQVPIPEPSSLIAWGALFGVGAVVSRRRKKK